MHRLSLDHLTVFSLTPPEQVALASRLGCEAVSIRVQPMPQGDIPGLDMIGNTPMRKETKRLAQSLGVEIYLVEAFLLFGRTDIEPYRAALESAAELGASVVNVGCMDRDLARFADKFAALAEMAAAHGLKTSVEPFGAGPLFHVKEARTVVDHSGRSDTGIMTDVLHLTRAGDSARDLALFEPARILYAQLCDGPLQMPAEKLLEEAMFDRVLPGDGEFALSDYVRAIPAHVPLGVEVPMRRRETMGVGADARAAEAVQAARNVLSRIATEAT